MSYDSIAAQIDKCTSKLIERLAEAVAIPSVSPSVEYRQEVFRMVDWTEKLMTNLGISCQKMENPLEATT
uniref:Uncharacterized protein n=1 Tax=Globodera rostochiensis TaxID=31243 RepID=A0A914HBR3_GLORO